MASAAAAVFALWGSNASALALGQIVVQSTLGEPLRAEIDIPEMNAEEESSLRASVASPDAFSSAGLEYSALMTQLQVSFQKKSNGRPYLRIHSARAINAPYIDLVIEARWSSGRIVGSYTILIDPPNLQLQAVTPAFVQPAVATSTSVEPAPLQPTTSAEPLPVHTAPVTDSSTSSMEATPIEPEPIALPDQTDSSAPAAPRSDPSVKTPAAVTSPADSAASAATPAPIAPPEDKPRHITIKAGDTASKIAMRHLLPSGVSLDQMLVAMMRANPDALIDGNINRIRAGAVMTLPTAEQLDATPLAQARQILRAQSRDFNAYRQKLAASAPTTQVATADRRASGMVQAQVEDKKATTSAPDKLTLSKGAVQPSDSQADKIARDLNAKETAERAENAAKNIAELSKIATAAGAQTEPASNTTAPSPTLSVTAGAPTPPPTATPAPAAPPPPPKAAPKPPRPVVVTPPPATEASLLDELLEDPLIPAAAGVLVALLGGLGFYRSRQRRKISEFEDSTLDAKPFGKQR